MKIIDTHVHIYPDAIAEKAMESISNFYGLSVRNPCKISDLVSNMRQNGIEKSVVCSVATSKHQVCKINDFMASCKSNPLFHPLATLHPDMDRDEITCEIARIKELGLKGLKIHPDCQSFKLNGERGRKLFDALGDFELPILVHTGDRRFDFSHPEYMIDVARDYPHLTFVAAHFGGWTEWDQAMKYKGLKNVFFDTSSSLFRLDAHIAKTVIFGLGLDKFMFGTDFPMWKCTEEIERVLSLDLGEKNNEHIFSLNAKRVFKIE